MFVTFATIVIHTIIRNTSAMILSVCIRRLNVIAIFILIVLIVLIELRQSVSNLLSTFGIYRLKLITYYHVNILNRNH